MPQGRIYEDFMFTGDVVFSGAVTLPGNVIRDAQVRTDAAIAAQKLEHQNVVVWSQASTMTTERRAVYVAAAAGTIQSISFGSATVCTGDATFTIDVKKNGTTILTTPVVLDSGNSVFALESATLAAAAYVAGDVIEVDATASPGTGALGVRAFGRLIVREAAS